MTRGAKPLQTAGTAQDSGPPPRPAPDRMTLPGVDGAAAPPNPPR